MAVARKKTAARKTVRPKPKATVQRRRAAAKPVRRRRKSTAEPKRIIQRKKPTARKRQAAKPTARGRKTTAAAPREVRTKEKLAAKSKLNTDVKALMKTKGMTPEKAAKKLHVSVASVNRAIKAGSVSPKERIVGTDGEVGKRIAALRKEGVPWPTIRARTGLTGGRIRKLYEETTGKAWQDSGPSATAARKSTADKPTASRKKTAATRKPGRKVAARRKRVTADEETAPRRKGARATKSRRTRGPKDADSSAGQLKGRRGRKARLTAMLDEVWDGDTTDDRLTEILEGRKIEITRDSDGRKMRPIDSTVSTVKSVTIHDRHGKVITYTNEAAQQHYVATREITALK